MQNKLTSLRVIGAVVMAGTVTVAVLAAAVQPAVRQPPPTAYRAQRLADGRPNLNGIWQAVGSANWNIQDHEAQAGLPQLGAIGAAPGGQGIVDGNEIPYNAAGLAK